MSSSLPPIVADRYRLVAPLGQGGMGRVWRAADVVLHRDVAIKELVPPPGLTAEERQEMRERSLREARAIARLNNVNVVRVFDVLRTDADPWIVMEYVPSRSLQDVLAAEGPFMPIRAAEIGLGVLNALRAAHRAGVVHRDVKPGNVLIGADGRVVLTDFGLATVPGDPNVTRTGLVLGSPAYIAPERARDGTAGPAADLWSLGATLYAAVEGSSPFARPSAIATLAALATENPPAAKNAGPLKPVLNGLLRKDPTHRINAEEAERLLLRATGKRSKLSFPMSPTMRRPSAGRERPALGSPGMGGFGSGSTPVVPGPRPPAAPTPGARPASGGRPGGGTAPAAGGRPMGEGRQGGVAPAAGGRPMGGPAHPPGNTPSVQGRAAAGEGRPPVFVPGKASVGRPSDTPTKVDGPKADAPGADGTKKPQLDATKLDGPPVKDAVPIRPGTGAARPVSPARPVDPNLTRTSRGEFGSFTAADVAAHRRKSAAPEHERSLREATALVQRIEPRRKPADTPADATTVMPAAAPADATTVVPQRAMPADPTTVVPQKADLTTVVPQKANLTTAVPQKADPKTAVPQGADLTTAVPQRDDVIAEEAIAEQSPPSDATTVVPATDVEATTLVRPQAGTPAKQAEALPADLQTGTEPVEESATSANEPAEPQASGTSDQTEPPASEPDTQDEASTDSPGRTTAAAASAAEAEQATDSKAVEAATATAEPEKAAPAISAGPVKDTRKAKKAAKARTNAVREKELGEESSPSDDPLAPVPLLNRSTRPAWKPMDVRPRFERTAGITVFGTRLTYRQAAVGVAIVLALVLLIGTLMVQAFSGGDKKTNAGKAAAGKPSATATKAVVAAQPAPSATTTTPSAAVTTPSVSPSATSASPSATGFVLPAGWKMASQPASGSNPAYEVPVPVNAQVTYQGGEYYYRWNNRLLIIDRSGNPKSDAYADLQQQAQNPNKSNYSSLGIRHVSYMSFPSVADWEFTYTTSSGNPQHAVKRNIRASTTSAYMISWYVSPDDWGPSQSDLNVIYAGFKAE